MAEGEIQTSQQQPAAGAPPPGTPPPAGVQEPAKPKPAVAKVEGATVQETKRVRLKGGEDEIPEDADLIEMTPRAFAARVHRMSNKQLKELFGTDDTDQIKKDQAELKEHRDNKEKARVEALSKEQKAEEEKRKAEGRADTAERALKQEREDRTFEKQDGHMARLAGKWIDEDHVDVELKKFARHLVDTYKPKQLEKLKGKALDDAAKKYFEGRVAEKPKIGKDYDSVRREELKAELRGDKPKVKVTNGANGAPPDSAKSKLGNAEALIPGKMSAADYRKWKKDKGYTY